MSAQNTLRHPEHNAGHHGTTFGLYFTATGCVQAPSPAASQTASRTHFFPVASNGIRSVFVPNAVVSVRLTILRSTVVPSLHTTSAKSSGKVYSMFAVYTLFAPEPSIAQLWNRISPVVPKKFPSWIPSTIGAQLSL